MRIRSRALSWEAIRAFYARLISEHGRPLGPLLELVEFLGGEPYGAALFAFTSHAVLHVSRVADFELHDNDLEIEFDPKTEKFRFTYWQNLAEANPWSISVERQEWKPRLQRVLLDRLQWFQNSIRATNE